MLTSFVIVLKLIVTALNTAFRVLLVILQMDHTSFTLKVILLVILQIDQTLFTLNVVLK